MNREAEKNVASVRERSGYSIILPVLNEAPAINATITHLRALTADDSVEIIVVDGDPAGSTVRELRDPEVVTAATPPGRSIQMNRGAGLASGEVLLFLHADTRLPQDAFVLVKAALQDLRVQAGAFELGIDSPRPLFRITERYVSIRTRLTSIPFGDQAIFIRRSYFESLGGFREIPIMEDVDLMKRIRARGDRICILPAKVRTSDRRWRQEGILYCTVRNWTLQLGFALGVKPEKLKKWYR